MRIHVDLQSQDFSFPALVQVFGIQFCLGQRGDGTYLAPSIHLALALGSGSDLVYSLSPFPRQGQVWIDIPVLVIGVVFGITVIFGLAGQERRASISWDDRLLDEPPRMIGTFN